MMLRHFFNFGFNYGISIAALVAILGISTSCGYQLVDKNRQLPGGYKLVAVPVFINRTQETGIEAFLTNALKKEIFLSKLVDVTEESLAPASIIGTIQTVSYSQGAQVTGTADDTSGQVAALPESAVLTTDYRINLVVDLSVRRNSDQKIIWTGRFHGERSYLAPQIGTESINSSNALYNHSARLQNIEIMAKDLMSEGYARMTENF